MLIQLRRILVHHLLGRLHRILVLQSRRPFLVVILLFFDSMLLLLFWMLVDEEILDGSFSGRSLVDGKARGEFFVRADLDCVQHGEGEVLAVVADQVVGGLFGSHFVNGHFT